jgi:hypothetical protein
MHIEERLLQILEYAPRCEDGWMDSADVFSATMQYLPSISNLLTRAGVKPESMETAATNLHKLATFNRKDIKRPNIQFTLYFFNDYHYWRIRKKGSISALDLITAILESDDEVSELAADILNTANLQGDYWDEDNSNFVADLVDRIYF